MRQDVLKVMFSYPLSRK